jgi:hypothetical protein
MLVPADDPGKALHGLRRGARCRVVVSSVFARYALVPFSADVVGHEANVLLAKHVFRRIHGERVDAWCAAVAHAPAGAALMACALDTELLARLDAAARERGVTLLSVEPALAAAFNAARRRLPDSCWVAIAEPQYLAVGLLRARQWRYLATERGAADTAAATRALAREAILAEEDGSALPRWLVRIDERCQASAERLPGPSAT